MNTYNTTNKNSINVKNSVRLDFIDLAKGFCILLVVLTHVETYFNFNYPGEIGLKIFRMPLYFFLSGLFFKEYDGFVGFLKRKTNKLLIPFLFFFFTSSVCLPILLNMVGVHIRNAELIGWKTLFVLFHPSQRVFPNGPIWFLLCLFILNILFYSCKIVSLKLHKNIQSLFLIFISFTLGLIGHWLGRNHIPLLFYSDIALSAMPFFCIGYIFRKYTNLLVPNRFDKYNGLIIIFCAVYTFIFAQGVSYINNGYCHPFIMYSCGLTGTIMIILIAKKIRKLPFISFYGRYSIIILCTHNLLLGAIVPIIKKFTSNSNELIGVLSVLILLFALYLIIIPLCLKYLPYVTAQKDIIPIKQNV